MLLDAYPDAKPEPTFRCIKCKKLVIWTINALCETCFKMRNGK